MTTGKDQGALKNDISAVDAATLKKTAADHLKYTIGKDEYSATLHDWYKAFACTLRDHLIERWLATHRSYHDKDKKRVYYLSMEFLIGKTFDNSLINLGIRDEFAEAVKDHGFTLDKIIEVENEAGLGNGGLGRLAACFLDSMATLGIPGYGYGIRFEYGMFRQKIKDFQQVEHPDNWLRYGNPWEFPRPEFIYPIKFGGRSYECMDEQGKLRHEWVDTDDVMAMAYDIPIPGFRCRHVNNLRLWAAKSSRDFDLKYFNHGDYIKSVEQKNNAENISKILYPNDAEDSGKVLRLKQEYFLVSATLQDIFRRYKKHHKRLDAFPDKVAIQLNDTHPALAIAELMRLLVDHEGLGWDTAWDMTTSTVNYTNHTVLPEALEKWPVHLLENLFPRHLQIIYEINSRFLKGVSEKKPGDADILRRTSIIEEGPEKLVRMANLAVIGSHKVNGVAAIHSEILKNDIFRDFSGLYPGKFTNKTNGISQRVWLKKANKPLSALITKKIGEAWITDLFELKKLIGLADDKAFREEWRRTKKANKETLSAYMLLASGVKVNVDSLFDVQVKRIHEYKRQLLNVLHVITLYNRIRGGGKAGPPRTIIFSGKAAPGYRIAKEIIALINSAANAINNDPAIGDALRVAFVPNYNVTVAELIIPAADLSEQISTAGTEASGTGCMKLALNGALTICTLDGANIEMKEEMGDDNIFVFGKTAREVSDLKKGGYNPWDFYNSNEELKQAVDMIKDGFFSPDDRDRFKGVARTLLEQGDNYLVLADYADYVRCQERAGALYSDGEAWAKKSILSVAGMGKFSSDRTIKEYAEEIWGIKVGKAGKG